jgi:hypothetical protein
MPDQRCPFIPSTANMRRFSFLSSDEQVTRFIGDGQRSDESTITSGIDPAFKHLPLEEAGTISWFIAAPDTDPVALVAQPSY